MSVTIFRRGIPRQEQPQPFDRTGKHFFQTRIHTNRGEMLADKRSRASYSISAPNQIEKLWLESFGLLTNEMTDEVPLPIFDSDIEGEGDDNAAHFTSTGITDTAAFQTDQDKEEENSATHNNSRGMNETEGFQTKNDRDIEELGRENMLLKSLVDCLHSSIVEAKDNPIISAHVIKPDSPLYVQHRQIQNILNIFKKMERYIKQIKDENKCMESLMSSLHDEFSTGTEANPISFELPSEIPPDSAVASSYKAAQAIWRIFMKLNSSPYRGKEKNTKKNKKLLKSEEDIDRSRSRENETVMKLRSRQIEMLTDKLEQCNVNFQIQLELNTVIDEKWKSDRERLEKANNSLRMLELQMTNHQQGEIRFKEAYDAEVMKTENQRKKLDGLQLKCDELLNRLSKLASGRLIHENTNIADLSDANRPEKLAETYSELYDNEWTDAFEELINQGLPDKEAVGKLLHMLLMSFDKCREITWERYRSLQSIMSTIDIHVVSYMRGFPEGTKTSAIQSELSSHQSNNTNVTINLEASKKEHLVCSTAMSFDQEHEIKRIWRTTTTALRDEAVKDVPSEWLCVRLLLLESAVREPKNGRASGVANIPAELMQLHSVLLTKCDISSTDAFPNTSKYLAICIDLCWKMGVQDKPMHLDADVETGDSSEKMLDLNKFRLYTKTGNRVDFVVWPALFMYEGGPVLVKGIAQACNETH